MDSIIDGRFERLEKALAGLIDSVTKYHPSTSLAEELMAADAELSKGLEQGKANPEPWRRNPLFLDPLCLDLEHYC